MDADAVGVALHEQLAALDIAVDPGDLTDQLQARIKDGMSVAEAKNAIVRKALDDTKYSTADLFAAAEGRTSVDLSSSDELPEWVNVAGQVSAVTTAKTWEKVAQQGVLADRSGTIPFISWKKSNPPRLRLGDTVALRKAAVETTDWGDPLLQINRATEIDPLKTQLQFRPRSERVIGQIIGIRRPVGTVAQCAKKYCGTIIDQGTCDDHPEAGSGNEYTRIDLRVLCGGRTITVRLEDRVAHELVNGIFDVRESNRESFRVRAPGRRAAVHGWLMGKRIKIWGRRGYAAFIGERLAVLSTWNRSPGVSPSVGVQNHVETLENPPDVIGHKNWRLGVTRKHYTSGRTFVAPTLIGELVADDATEIEAPGQIISGHTYADGERRAIWSHTRSPLAEVVVAGTVTEVRPYEDRVEARIADPTGGITAIASRGKKVCDMASQLAGYTTPQRVIVTGRPRISEADQPYLSVREHGGVTKSTKYQTLVRATHNTIARLHTDWHTAIDEELKRPNEGDIEAVRGMISDLYQSI